MTSVFSVATKAEIYKHVDADGRITYSNIKSKGATRLDIDPDSNVIKNDRPRTCLLYTSRCV